MNHIFMEKLGKLKMKKVVKNDKKNLFRIKLSS